VDVTTEAPAVILIVDDDRNGRETLRRALARDGYETLTAENGRKALALAQDKALDLVLTDLIMPGLGGLDFIAGLQVVQPEVPVILISAFANVDTAVKAVRRGVHDVLEKPIRLRDVRRAVKRALESRPAGRERIAVLTGTVTATDVSADSVRDLGHRNIVGASPAFLEMLDVVARVAPVSSTALILGESGTGKELVAEALHRHGGQRAGPLVKVACAALAEGVLEAELFGSERGAYTGAHEQRKGRFELADGGTLFLDEIGEISLALQVKLLRVLQEGEFERVGGTETLKVKVRVIAATNRDLERAVEEDRFREDLYWRLNVIAINVPPLRERRADIVPLAEHFLAKVCEATSKSSPSSFDPAVLDRLRGWDWPGNVRELENAVERAVVLARADAIRIDDLPAALRAGADQQAQPAAGIIQFEVGQSLASLEREAIRLTLEAVAGNREAAASILGISAATLYRRLKEMGEVAGGASGDDAEGDQAEGNQAEGNQAEGRQAEGNQAEGNQAGAAAGTTAPDGTEASGQET